MKSDHELTLALDKYADMVRRICFVQLKQQADVEDIFQEVFLKYALQNKAFQSEAHEKAWLIRVASNACKDTFKNFFRREVSSLSELTVEPAYLEDDKREVLEAVLALPPKYKDVIYLFYYEGYTAREIAELLHTHENTVYTQLARARARLNEVLGAEYFEE
jgi:RNA polymerase sigma-70 factor (ECF subfamily)